MARARNIKPGFFKNEVLAEIPLEARLLFIGIWTLADREGRLEDRPRRIKAELFAFDSFDVDPMLTRLQSEGFLARYEVNGTRFIQITNFVKHQDPHYKEKASEIPPPPGHENKIVATNVSRTQRARILERDGYKCQFCGAESGLCIDHILPVSRGGDSADENLQTLCATCNTKKGNKLAGETLNTTRPRYEPIAAPEVEPTSSQRRVNTVASVPLTPSSLIPDSLNLIPDSIEETSRKRFDTPSGVSESVWQDFKKLRKAKKAAITNTAMAGIQREASKAGYTFEQALKTCCERGWTGFNADWVKADQAKATGETAYQRSMRERFEEASGRKTSNIIDITPGRMEALL